METNKRTRILSVIAAVAFALITMALGYRKIGLPPVVIVGGSSVIALVMWIKYYLRKPLAPEVILPLFLLTVAALEIHMAEEYLTGFGPAMSRLFDISWTERSFLIVFAFVGPALYSLTALGLFYRVPFAGFLAWFIFIGPGVAEFTHFIFPLLQPAIQPELPGTISQAVSNGRFVADMRELLHRDDRPVLLPRHVYRGPPDDPRHLGHRANGPVPGAGSLDFAGVRPCVPSLPHSVHPAAVRFGWPPTSPPTPKSRRCGSRSSESSGPFGIRLNGIAPDDRSHRAEHGPHSGLSAAVARRAASHPAPRHTRGRRGRGALPGLRGLGLDHGRDPRRRGRGPVMAPRQSSPLRLVLAGGLVAGTLDIVYACVFWAVKAGVPVRRIFQSVAAGLLGKASFEGGAATAALGLGLHYFIACSMAVAYYLVARRVPALRERPVPYGAAYGLLLYGIMNYIVVPALRGRGRRREGPALGRAQRRGAHVPHRRAHRPLRPRRAAGSAHAPARARLTQPAVPTRGVSGPPDSEAPHWG